MSLTAKYIPIDRIVENVYRDHPFESSVNWEYCLEWAGSVLRLIGASSIMEKQIKCVVIEDYKGELPDGILNIDLVRFKSTSTDPDTTSISYQAMRYEGDPFIIKEYCSCESGCKTLCSIDSDITYALNNNYIFTSFEEGQIELAVDVFPVDDRGYPLIPDNESVIQAVTWFIAYKIAYDLWMTDHLSERKFKYIEQQKDWYVGKAISKAKTPSKDQMETFKNMSLRLIPKIDAHQGHFGKIGHQERRYNHNSNPSQGDVSSL